MPALRPRARRAAPSVARSALACGGALVGLGAWLAAAPADAGAPLVEWAPAAPTAGIQGADGALEPGEPWRVARPDAALELDVAGPGELTLRLRLARPERTARPVPGTVIVERGGAEVARAQLQPAVPDATGASRLALAGGGASLPLGAERVVSVTLVSGPQHLRLSLAAPGKYAVAAQALVRYELPPIVGLVGLVPRPAPAAPAPAPAPAPAGATSGALTSAPGGAVPATAAAGLAAGLVPLGGAAAPAAGGPAPGESAAPIEEDVVPVGAPTAVVLPPAAAAPPAAPVDPEAALAAELDAASSARAPGTGARAATAPPATLSSTALAARAPAEAGPARGPVAAAPPSLIKPATGDLPKETRIQAHAVAGAEQVAPARAPRFVETRDGDTAVLVAPRAGMLFGGGFALPGFYAGVDVAWLPRLPSRLLAVGGGVSWFQSRRRGLSEDHAVPYRLDARGLPTFTGDVTLRAPTGIVRPYLGGGLAVGAVRATVERDGGRTERTVAALGVQALGGLEVASGPVLWMLDARYLALAPAAAPARGVDVGGLSVGMRLGYIVSWTP